ncbi:MAG: hypothetical protein AAF368_18785, partial [Planctomycetota bacterium]
SVTDEPASTVEPFLAKKPLKSWIGLDADSSSFKAYGVRGIPRTIVVGPDGRIAADTYPTSLTAEGIERVTRGEAIGLPPVEDGGFEDDMGMDFPETIEEWNALRLQMTAPGPELEMLAPLAGRWETKNAHFPAGEMGPEIAATSGTTGEWTQNKRSLRLIDVSPGEPALATTMHLGYNSMDRAYYLCELSPFEPAPQMWTGSWDDGASVFTFTRSEEVEMMMGDPGAGEPDEDDLESVELKHVFTIDLSKEGAWTMERSIDFSGFDLMGGAEDEVGEFDEFADVDGGDGMGMGADMSKQLLFRASGRRVTEL